MPGAPRALGALSPWALGLCRRHEHGARRAGAEGARGRAPLLAHRGPVLHCPGGHGCTPSQGRPSGAAPVPECPVLCWEEVGTQLRPGTTWAVCDLILLSGQLSEVGNIIIPFFCIIRRLSYIEIGQITCPKSHSERERNLNLSSVITTTHNHYFLPRRIKSSATERCLLCLQ